MKEKTIHNIIGLIGLGIYAVCIGSMLFCIGYSIVNPNRDRDEVQLIEKQSYVCFAKGTTYEKEKPCAYALWFKDGDEIFCINVTKKVYDNSKLGGMYPLGAYFIKSEKHRYYPAVGIFTPEEQP